MKSWFDIPEGAKLLKRISEDDRKLEEEQKAKGIHLEFDPVIEQKHREWADEFNTFCDNYIKAHPEEFDKNGRFKEDT